MSESGRKKRSRRMYMAKADEILDSSTQANADISLSQESENHTHDAHIGLQDQEFTEAGLEVEELFDECTCTLDHSLLSEDEEIPKVEEFSFRKALVDWFHVHRPSREASNQLLDILRSIVPDLPRDVRTLLAIPSSVVTQDMSGGQFYYFGIQNQIGTLLKSGSINREASELEIQVSVDGLPLFKSSKGQFWPILISVNGLDPVPVSLFYGDRKPDLEPFLHEFTTEFCAIKDGFHIDGIEYHLSISQFVCDAPARAFLKHVVGHTGYFGCERCEIKGEREQGRMVFNEINCALRTDNDFASANYSSRHQTGISPLASVFPCVSGFVLDYMHLVCLGVVRRMLMFWRKEKTSLCRLTASKLALLGDRLSSLNGLMPSEFARQPRSISECDRFKATEFRQFLLYTGCVVLKGVVSSAVYKHFLLLSVALAILLCEDDDRRIYYLPYAKQLLRRFVLSSSTLYGSTFPTYNVHSLLHLPDDCSKFNCSLNKISAFPYETKLNSLKKLVKNASNPLVSVVKHYKTECRPSSSKKPRSTRYNSSPKDCIVWLKSQQFAMIVNSSDSTLYVKIVPESIIDDLYKEPFRSSHFNIVVVQSSQLLRIPVEAIEIERIQSKAVRIPFGDSLVLIPLCHVIHG